VIRRLPVAPLAAVLLGMLPLSTALAADPGSPLGLWKTIDDKTGAAKAVVRIYEQDGKLFGKVVATLAPNARRVCEACTDARKNQPIVGMVIMRNMKADGSVYDGGDILDPDNGSVYSCKIHLEGNTRLVVRGFLGISLLGRSQTWQRQADEGK
jgi:uncharacterized protein (DUF2147 family)